MSTPLRRRIVCFVLVALALVWAVPGAYQPAVQGLAHEWVHLQSQSHGHQQDDSLMLGEVAAAESPHTHAGDLAKPLGGHASGLASPATFPARIYVPVDGPYCLSIFLERPLRPPSAMTA